jgi:hypothetical protein
MDGFSSDLGDKSRGEEVFRVQGSGKEGTSRKNRKQELAPTWNYRR